MCFILHILLFLNFFSVSISVMNLNVSSWKNITLSPFKEGLPDLDPSFSDNPLLIALYRSKNKKCIDSIKEIQNGIHQGKIWALEFYDANPSMSITNWDILDLNYGHFEECSNIVSSVTSNISFNGKFCWGGLKIEQRKIYKLLTKIQGNMKKPKSEFMEGALSCDSTDEILNGCSYFSFCIPDTCEPEDMQLFFRDIFKRNVYIKNNLCGSYKIKPELLNSDIPIVVFFAVWISIIISSTIYEYFTMNNKEKRLPVIMVFSLYKNANYIFKIDVIDKKLFFLNGLRVLSTFCITMGHRFAFFLMMPLVNKEDQMKYLQKFESMEYLGVSLAIDTFLTLSGIILTFQIYSRLQKVNFIKILLLYLNRYIRLTAPLAALILFHISILKFIMITPHWPLLKKYFESNCRVYWWSSILYIQNFVNSTQLCLGHTWYLSLDMQIFIVAPFMVIFLKRYPRITFYSIVALVIASVLFTFYICWVHEIKAISFAVDFGHNATKFFDKYYSQTLCRVAPYLLGILTADIMIKTKPKLDERVVFLLWIAAFIFMGISFFGFHDLIMRHEPYNKLQHSAYNALTRPVWSLGLCILIYLCYHGYGGIITKILSVPHYSILTKICYCVYLVNFHVQLYVTVKQLNRIRYERFEVYRRIFSDFGISLLIGLLWTLLFELPAINLFNILRRRLIKKNISPTKEKD